jgi:hypothetical protein
MEPVTREVGDQAYRSPGRCSLGAIMWWEMEKASPIEMRPANSLCSLWTPEQLAISKLRGRHKLGLPWRRAPVRLSRCC